MEKPFQDSTVDAVIADLFSVGISASDGLPMLRRQVVEQLRQRRGELGPLDKRVREYYVIGRAATPHPKYCLSPGINPVMGMQAALDCMDTFVRWALPEYAPVLPIDMQYALKGTRVAISAEGVARLYWGDGGLRPGRGRGSNVYWVELYVHADYDRAGLHLAELKAESGHALFLPGQAVASVSGLIRK